MKSKIFTRFNFITKPCSQDWLYFVYQNFQNGYFRTSLFSILFEVICKKWMCDTVSLVLHFFFKRKENHVVHENRKNLNWTLQKSWMTSSYKLLNLCEKQFIVRSLQNYINFDIVIESLTWDLKIEIKFQIVLKCSHPAKWVILGSFLIWFGLPSILCPRSWNCFYFIKILRCCCKVLIRRNQRW